MMRSQRSQIPMGSKIGLTLWLAMAQTCRDKFHIAGLPANGFGIGTSLLKCIQAPNRSTMHLRQPHLPGFCHFGGYLVWLHPWSESGDAFTQQVLKWEDVSYQLPKSVESPTAFPIHPNNPKRASVSLPNKMSQCGRALHGDINGMAFRLITTAHHSHEKVHQCGSVSVFLIVAETAYKHNDHHPTG